jgi:hypothetical protein
MKTLRYAFASCVFLLGVAFAVAAQPSASSITKILDSGNDGQKLVLAILGDGYAAGDQLKFHDDVDRLVLQGVFGHDFYRANQRAFNIYRVDLISTASGVSTTTAPKDTALQTVFTGTWAEGWINLGTNTDRLIDKAVSAINKVDYVLVVLNESNYGGVAYGNNRQYVTCGSPWEVTAHEYGHAIGGLYDEYAFAGNGRYIGLPVNVQNCSTIPDRSRVAWKLRILPGTNIPTVFDQTMDPNSTVGMFEGCYTFETGIYRPVDECRMNTNTPPFCPVCLALMERAVASFLGDTASSGGPAPIAYLKTLSGLGSTAGVPTYGSVSTLTIDSGLGAAFPIVPWQTRPAVQDGTHVHLVVRISKTGGFEILQATQVPGRLLSQQNLTGPYVYEIRTDGQTETVHPIPLDPFAVRGYPDPNRPRGHRFAQSETTTTVLEIPNESLETLKRDNIYLRIDKIAPTTQLNVRGTGIDVKELDDLKNSNNVIKKIDKSLRSAMQRVDGSIAP